MDIDILQAKLKSIDWFDRTVSYPLVKLPNWIVGSIREFANGSCDDLGLYNSDEDGNSLFFQEPTLSNPPSKPREPRMVGPEPVKCEAKRKYAVRKYCETTYKDIVIEDVKTPWYYARLILWSLFAVVALMVFVGSIKKGESFFMVIGSNFLLPFVVFHFILRFLVGGLTGSFNAYEKAPVEKIIKKTDEQIRKENAELERIYRLEEEQYESSYRYLSKRYEDEYKEKMRQWENSKRCYPIQVEQYHQDLLRYEKELAMYKEEQQKYTQKREALIQKYCSQLFFEKLQRSLQTSTSFTAIDNAPQRGRSEDLLFHRLMKSNLKKNVRFDVVALGYYPDVVIINADLNVNIDIEIDEPYTIVDGKKKEIHYIGCGDEARNDKFVSNNWFVIRFSENQVLKHLEKCFKLIEAVYCLLTNQDICQQIDAVSDAIKAFPEEPRWTKEEARLMAIENSRG